MFLYVSEHILHIILIGKIVVLVICAAPISMARRREFHVHYWLVRKVLLLVLLRLLLVVL